MDHHDVDTFVERPWGQYFKFYQESGVWVKRVEVLVGQRLSLQYHNNRSEKWIIVKGEGVASVNGQEIPLTSGSVVDVPQGAKHRIGNTGEGKLVFIEVATGDALSESDIVRIQDDYQREE